MEEKVKKVASEWQQPINICRCCLSEGCYKDVATEYFLCGQKEVYADMLLETFNVCISYQEGGGPSSGSRLICDECILRLRAAHKFKKQVVHSESTFVQHLESLRNKGKNESDEFKLEEIKGENEDDRNSDEYDFPALDDDPGIDDETLVNIKIEDFKEEPIDECSLTIEKPMVTRSSSRKRPIRSAPKQTKKPRITKKMPKTDEEPSCSAVVTKGDGKPKVKRNVSNKLSKKSLQEIRNLNNNTKELIKNSNLTLFTWTKRQYKCYLCNECHKDMAKLKSHQSSSHSHQEIENRQLFMTKISTVKADISALECKLCTQSCKDLNQLVEHLTKHHGITFFNNANHLLIPYKIQMCGFSCQICEQQFNTFKPLTTHMNLHYQNYVCDMCGIGFANRQNLRLHHRNYHVGTTKCNLCNQTFNNQSEKGKHKRKFHNEIPNKYTRRLCAICDEVLPNNYTKLLHMIKEHGMTKPEFKCHLCDRSFIVKTFLSSHIRNVHNREKNHACDVCHMRFYATYDLRRHMRSHDSEKSISCSYCEVMFKDKDSLRRHLKRAHNNLLK